MHATISNGLKLVTIFFKVTNPWSAFRDSKCRCKILQYRIIL